MAEVGGGGHGGGGGHSGGGYSGGHSGGGYHGGGYYGGGRVGYGGYTHHYPGYGYYPGYSGIFFPGVYLGGYGYGYGYGYGNQNYYYPSNYGYTYTDPSYPYVPTYVNPGTNTTVPATVAVQGAYLGIDEEAVVDPEGQGMKVVNIYPGSAAERAGLQVGDVIHSANGFLTQVHGNLTWIINTQAPNGVLNLNVRRASDGRDVAVVAQLP